MPDPVERGPNIGDVASALRELEARVARLEDRLGESSVHGGVAPLSPSPEVAAIETSNPDSLLNPTLIGRTFVVLGGAYLLRAFTESGAVSLQFGVVMGILYATVWIVLAARGGSLSSATYHGAAGILIGHPLLWEAATRFRVMLPEAGAFGMAILALAGIGIAWRRRIAPLAWVSILGACGALIALAVSARQFSPSIAALLLITIAAVAAGAQREWRVISWPLLVVADFLVLALLFLVAIQKISDTRTAATFLCVGLFLVSLSALALARRFGDREIGLAAMAQAAVAVPIGLTGSVLIAGASGPRLAIGVLALVVAMGCYLVAWTDRTQLGVGFYTTLGLAVGLHGGILTFPDSTAWLIWMAIGILGVAAAERAGSVVIAVHSAIGIGLAAIASGLAGYALSRMFISVPERWPAVDVPIAATFAALLAIVFFIRRSRPAQFLILGMICVGVAGFAIELGASVAAPLTRAVLAAVRMIVLATLAIALAWISRFERFSQAAAFVTPLLLLGGAKLIIEDFLVGAAATQFVSLASYGIAIAVASTLVRKTAKTNAAAS
ncbi:MAG TPA: hypothetical protein VIL97_08230 [Thermoanaerobaculia bacterium]